MPVVTCMHLALCPTSVAGPTATVDVRPRPPINLSDHDHRTCEQRRRLQTAAAWCGAGPGSSWACACAGAGVGRMHTRPAPVPALPSARTQARAEEAAVKNTRQRSLLKQQGRLQCSSSSRARTAGGHSKDSHSQGGTERHWFVSSSFVSRDTANAERDWTRVLKANNVNETRTRTINFDHAFDRQLT